MISNGSSNHHLKLQKAETLFHKNKKSSLLKSPTLSELRSPAKVHDKMMQFNNEAQRDNDDTNRSHSSFVTSSIGTLRSKMSESSIYQVTDGMNSQTLFSKFANILDSQAAVPQPNMRTTNHLITVDE